MLIIVNLKEKWRAGGEGWKNRKKKRRAPFTIR
jgi:hypothetical protein